MERKADPVKKLVTLAFVFLLSAPQLGVAGPILDQAMQHAGKVRLTTAEAATTLQPADCAAASQAGATDGNQRQGMVGWIVGGFFLPVIMPVVAHVTAPQPPADLVLRYSGDDARCYAAAYSSAASSKRRTGAWIGSGAMVGLLVAAVASASGDVY